MMGAWRRLPIEKGGSSQIYENRGASAVIVGMFDTLRHNIRIVIVNLSNAALNGCRMGGRKEEEGGGKGIVSYVAGLRLLPERWLDHYSFVLY